MTEHWVQIYFNQNEIKYISNVQIFEPVLKPASQAIQFTPIVSPPFFIPDILWAVKGG